MRGEPDHRGEGDRRQHELEVRDDRRVLHTLLVDERVAGNRNADPEREQDAPRVRLSRHAPHEQDPASDEQDSHAPGPGRSSLP